MLFCVGNIFCDFADGHIVKIGRTQQVKDVLNPAGDGSTIELRVVVGHKQQNRRSDASAQTIVRFVVDVKRELVERSFQKSGGVHV